MNPIKAANPQDAIVNIFGYNFNVMTVAILVVLLMVLALFYRIQKDEKLDFADMITKDGRTISLTKVLQLLGGITATWVIIKLTLTGGLTEAIFGLYLTYVGAVEGYSKYVSAKYNYSEKSVRDAKPAKSAEPQYPDSRLPEAEPEDGPQPKA